jgi:hypothetical protein
LRYRAIRGRAVSDETIGTCCMIFLVTDYLHRDDSI